MKTMEICETQMIKMFTFESSVCPDNLFHRCIPSADALKPFWDPVVLL